MKKVKDVHNENYKSQEKEIEEDIRLWKDIPYSWLDRINIMKMGILPKAIYMLNAIFTKIPMIFFMKTEKPTLMITHKCKRP
jgi:hypothetical protein